MFLWHVTTDKLNFDEQEISDVRFWNFNEIISMKGSNVFTPNFEQEFDRLQEFLMSEKLSIFPDAFYTQFIG